MYLADAFIQSHLQKEEQGNSSMTCTMPVLLDIWIRKRAREEIRSVCLCVRAHWLT